MSHKQDSLVTLCRKLESSLGAADNLSDIETAASALNSLDELSRRLDRADQTMQPGPAVKQNLLASIRRDTPNAGFVERLMTMFDLPRVAIQRILRRIPRQAGVPGKPWQEPGLEGVYLLHFSGGPRVAGADCGLIYLEPGALFPNHQHLGQELALVLQGNILEDARHLYRPGDRVLKRAGSRHSFTATKDEPAVIAVTLEQGISF